MFTSPRTFAQLRKNTILLGLFLLLTNLSLRLIKKLFEHRTGKPVISILIPMFNAEMYIGECLTSIKQQTFSLYEVIIVDDGSTDASLQIIRNETNGDGRFRLISHDRNLGTLVARKTAIHYAQGRYCCFLDPDDFFSSPKSLKTMISLMRSYKSDILHFSVDVVGSLNLPELEAQKRWFKVYAGRLCNSSVILSMCFLSHNYTHSLWDKVYKTRIWKLAEANVESFYCIYGEDALLFFLYAYYSQSYVGVKTLPLVSYRLKSGITYRVEDELAKMKRIVVSESCALQMLMNFLKSQHAFKRFYHLFSMLYVTWTTYALNRFQALQQEHRQEGLTILDSAYYPPMIRERLKMTSNLGNTELSSQWLPGERKLPSNSCWDAELEQIFTGNP